jgi:hypothetical protein
MRVVVIMPMIMTLVVMMMMGHGRLR